MQEYLIYCTECCEYSLLGRYLSETGSFEGEYSIVHNEYMQTGELLCRFLVEHRNHSLQVVPDKTESYKKVLAGASRFKEQDIDRYVEKSLHEKQKRQQKLADKQAVGQLEMTILKKMLEEEIEAVSAEKTDSPAESQFYLGKEEGIKEALNKLKQLTSETAQVFHLPRSNVQGGRRN
ncbi:MAG TPA: hypothetical protein VFK44_06510 [Bacillales bacterium]|nr:hypothetical protein [Bacillales bacterium]